MKHLPVAGKALTLLFTAAFLVACSSTDTKEADEAAAAAAAAEEAAAAEAAAAQAAINEQIRIRSEEVAQVGNVLYFEFDSSALTADAQRTLDAHIGLLQADSGKTVRLEGHTDERGTREYNIALGERRANSVRDYMVVNGIDSYRIETVSYGEEQPVAYGSGESNWAQNRRVEIK